MAPGNQLRSPIWIPAHINHLIYYTEYPDITGRAWIKDSDKVLLMSKWDDVLSTLRELHGDEAKVAVFPGADIQYRV